MVEDPEIVLVDERGTSSPPVWLVVDPEAFVSHELFPDSLPPCPLDLVTLLVLDFSPSFSTGVEAPEELPVLSAFSPPVIPDSMLSISLTLFGFVFVPSSLFDPRIPTKAFLFWSCSETTVEEAKLVLATVFTVEVLVGIFVDDVPFPLLPFRETFVFVPSMVDALLELELFPVPLEDSTIFKGGTFNPLPADTTSDVVPIPDDLPETLDELSLSSFSLSEWSRL